MEKTLLSKLEAKFTKANMYAVLKEYIETEEGTDSVNSLQDILDAVKPQKGGGASANPPKEIDGVTFHYCRLKDEYVAEEFMNMSGGKSKGTSILASKVAYRINKAADELKDKAMACFVAGEYENGAEFNVQQDALRATVEDSATFTDEAMVKSIYHPDFGKEVKENDILDEEQPAEDAEQLV